MNTRTDKTTKALSWEALRTSFPMGTTYVDGKAVYADSLTYAVENGLILNLLQECADELHDGNLYAAICAFSRKMSSQVHNTPLKAVIVDRATELKRVEILSKYTQELMATYGKRATSGTPQWAYGPADIDAITDIAVLQKVINSIADPASGKQNIRYAELLGDNWKITAMDNRDYARKRMTALKNQTPEIDTSLLEKLQSGKAAKLTTEETARLAALIASLKK